MRAVESGFLAGVYIDRYIYVYICASFVLDPSF